ncbi:MAG: hypothetical protein P8182_02995 [Deltaproteobacteria bacterium]
MAERHINMKSLLCAVCGLLIICLCPVNQLGHAQAPSKRQSGSPDQWASHQMNQPSPGSLKKAKLSRQRIDEIRQLYLEAKREFEAKHGQQSLHP